MLRLRCLGNAQVKSCMCELELMRETGGGMQRSDRPWHIIGNWSQWFSKIDGTKEGYIVEREENRAKDELLTDKGWLGGCGSLKETEEEYSKRWEEGQEKGGKTEGRHTLWKRMWPVVSNATETSNKISTEKWPLDWVNGRPLVTLLKSSNGQRT